MARKVFISFLGKTNYSQCIYTRDEYKSQSIRFIQEATLEYINSKTPWTKDDVAYILLTKDAETANWVDYGQIDRETKKPLEGLKTRISNLHYPLEIRTIEKLPIGNNESEIWEIFEKLFAVINDDDELYFDLTHGFRYLPMLVLVCGNYSKFLRKVSVKSITYGNFEYTEKEKPIVDLLPLSQLQDWTYAAGQYLDSGNVDKLFELSNKELKPILKEAKGANADATNLKQFATYLKAVVEERQTCRGTSIIKSDNLNKLKEYSNKLETTLIQPLNPIFEKIKHSLVHFDENENVKNGFAAAVWCFQNGFLQQSATILQEFVVSFFCIRHDIDITDEDNRDLINSAFTIKFNHISKEKWIVKEEKKPKVESILKDDLFDNSQLVNFFNNLTEVRNDLNHSGMRSKRKPQTSKSIKDNIQKCIEGFGVILYNIKIQTRC